MIAFYLEADSGIPAYLQLARQVEHAIRLGRLHAGDQLPSVRDVVAVLGINPNTVVKAYRELEARHLVDTRQGRGSFIADLATSGRSIPPSLARELADWIERAKTSGLTRSDIAALTDEKLHAAFPHEGAA
jgi:GntR family transcriptional regulator